MSVRSIEIPAVSNMDSPVVGTTVEVEGSSSSLDVLLELSSSNSVMFWSSAKNTSFAKLSMLLLLDFAMLLLTLRWRLRRFRIVWRVLVNWSCR